MCPTVAPILGTNTRVRKTGRAWSQSIGLTLQDGTDKGEHGTSRGYYSP